ncbi:MAG: Crp/Fnr family transcriptional regulator [Treponema sp.]|nr:Crp/Fnr family transcriptional regulator [Treponema sp.]
MDNVISVLKACPLFEGIAEGNIEKLLSCLPVRRKSYRKDNVILLAGERAGEAGKTRPGERFDSTVPMGIVLSGSLRIVQDDFWGNRGILASIHPGELFGEALSCAGVETPPVSVVAAEKSAALLFNCGTILRVCRAACTFHTTLITNLVGILANKNLMLVQKLEHISRRSIREKLLSYLSRRALEAGGNRFTIPYDRQELADYLSVDRSALSRELGRLRDQGLLSFRKNLFTMKEATVSPGRRGFPGRQS